MSVYRVLLRQPAQLHELSEYAEIDATFYDRSEASCHYWQRISFRVQKLKATKNCRYSVSVCPRSSLLKELKMKLR